MGGSGQVVHDFLELPPGERGPDFSVRVPVAAHERGDAHRGLEVGRLEDVDVVVRPEHREIGHPLQPGTRLAHLADYGAG